ncbi:XkdW family protein [Salinisphaera hydrothermalis]|uniref:Uncharacterized protein n=1 Tax=Salinisphaera hydrothermalis (strain C41B8) TaxID=1304275 RepID=A0A084INL7_SALHC|nr:XkdW family protein [Salinisphaera hydrothermalis]KEZ78301.1 hypothetical protein C41B8_05348 [Salinisphaera hydrothermalis C41B8]
MDLVNIVIFLKPNAVPVRDFLILDDGKGPYIGEWDTEKLGTKPTDAELSAAEQPAALAQAKVAKIAELTAACEAAITGGFESNALGTTHHYPSSATDQVNLMGRVTKSLLPTFPSGGTVSFTCVLPANKADSVWPRVDHTAAQIQQVGDDGEAWIDAQQLQLRALLAQVDAIDDKTGQVSDINAIQWSNGTP